MPTQRKIEIVAALSDKLGKAKSFFLADYRGLTHRELENLRKTLKRLQAEFLVTKNTLFKLALEKSKIQNPNIKEIKTELKNPTATLFAFGDEIAAIKELNRFIKNLQLPKIKIGLFAGQVVKEADFQKLATIPTRDVLLTTLAARIKGPIYSLHYALNWNIQKLVIVLNNIKSKK